ncbi:MAG: carbon monoxide dehydrogenase subunit G [Ancalomicrobiaceae bacterium]|nr:carbon monoxide dehydrogenase subunit G [Ancalomicrobiaceae bacterium]
MEMTGEYRIPASRAEVWAALNDPDVLRVSIPGCEALDMVSPTDMTAKVVTKIGPVKASFSGRVKLENIKPPNGYTISGEGSGGVAGSAKGGADVTLTEDGDETVLSYSARAHVSGKLAQLGGRLIDATAKMMADQFFAKFSAVVVERLSPPAEADVPAGSNTAPEVTAAAAAPAMAASEAAPRRVASRVHSAAPISIASFIPGWVWAAGGLIVGLLIGKFII